jgi:hypothetical protein
MRPLSVCAEGASERSTTEEAEVVRFDGARVAHDVSCVGARFDEADAESGRGVGVGYARELEML